MIVFDLCCAAGDHRFEAWFSGSDSFADQQARGLINCPVCGDADIKKAVMAPHVGAKSNRQPVLAAKPNSAQVTPDPSPDLVKRVLADIAAKQAEMLPHSRWVGRQFADAARAMHEGRATEELIHGQASPEEAQTLHEDGIAAMPLLVPVIPPDMAN